HTATYQRSGEAACFESSSSGSASPTRGPGSGGRTTYSQPVAASATASVTGTAPNLRSMQPPRGGEQRVGRVAAPQRPVVPAAHDAVAVRQAERRELLRERGVLLLEVVVLAAVEPDVGVRLAQLRRRAVDHQRRAVPLDRGLVGAEDRPQPVGVLAAGPALEHLELAGV